MAKKLEGDKSYENFCNRFSKRHAGCQGPSKTIKLPHNSICKLCVICNQQGNRSDRSLR
jgi:hypothetical protein